MRGRVRRMWRKKQRALIRRRAPWSPDRSDERHQERARARVSVAWHRGGYYPWDEGW